ncbi:hypothetical protein EDB82DRAFT_552145 [Fusarium venenatum]|uniref:uncharacterized protein n=1 Tax=Fusarium venenatum TaxID=56646 RepID=UPI001DD7B646|nr:hypothetical protein EDB82DRAFT_552145 [Fusarium venenatum]
MASAGPTSSLPSSSSTYIGHSEPTSTSPPPTFGPFVTKSAANTMAVLVEVPHITAWVRVAGELATEHGVPDDFEMIDHTRTADDTTPIKHCSIQCKSGAEFAIEVTDSSGFKIPRNNDAVWVDIYLDGEWRGNDGIYRRELLNKKHITINLSSALFSTDDSASKSKIEEDFFRAKDLGVIRIVISTSKCSKKQCKGSPCPTLTEQQQDFAEKASKGKVVSHTTTFAETGSIVPIPDMVNVENEVIAGNFFFHYRSHSMVYFLATGTEQKLTICDTEALQHELITPQTPSPEPPVVPDDGEDVLSHLSESEIRRLAMERLRDNNIKQESSGIKREVDEHPVTTRPWKAFKLDDGKEAFDLTDE